MKNYRYMGILLVLVVMAAVSLAGCTSTSSPSVTATPAASSGTQSVTATPTSSGSALSTLGSAFDLNKVHWYEYQMTVSGTETPATMKMKEEFNVNYQGATADKMTMNSETKDGSDTTDMAMEYYMDKSGNSLGGHYKITVNGQVVTESDLMGGQTTAGTGSDATTSNPFKTYNGASLTNMGADTVTVPAGTYACTKYTVTETDGSGTVWVSPQVPIPVKYEGKSGAETYSMELTGWG